MMRPPHVFAYLASLYGSNLLLVHSTPLKSPLPGELTLINANNNRYVVEIDVNSKTIPVLLNTANSDLLIVPAADIPPYSSTNIRTKLGFGDSSSVQIVEGDVGVSPISLGGFTVDQAFIVANTSAGQELDSYGIYGVLGVGFNTGSIIRRRVVEKEGVGAAWGNSFLERVFDQYPNIPRFFTIELSRTAEGTVDEVGSHLRIGDLNPRIRDNLIGAPKLDVFRTSQGEFWTVLLDKLVVGDTVIPLHSKVRGGPEDQAVAILHTGAMVSALPPSISDAFHKSIPGAVKGPRNVWIVPCKTPPVEVVIGQQTFPIHTLDRIMDKYPVRLPDGRRVRFCYSLFTDRPDPVSPNGFSPWDIVLGVNFLRNVFSLYHFGDQSDGKPYVQLMSRTTSHKSSLAPEFDDDYEEIPPADLVNLVNLDSYF